MKNLDLSLYLVTDGSSENEEKFLNTIEEAIEGGVSIVQLREKDAETGKFYNLALKVKEITDKHNVPLIINDRIDIMLAVDAEGLHIGQSDMPCDVSRKIIGEDKIIGVSATTKEEIRKAIDDGADYIGSGAVYPTKTKDDAPSITKEELKELVEYSDIPIVAIGGINERNASDFTDTGIAGISVVSAIMGAEDPKSASQTLKIF